MCPRIIATLIILLAGTGMALGQPVPAPGPAPAPAAPPLETLPPPAAFDALAGVVQPPVSGAIFPDDCGHPGRWMTRFDADAVLWFSPVHHGPTFIDSPLLAGTVVAGGGSHTLGDENIPRHMLPGARVALGYWWMEENAWTPGRWLPMVGFETRFMFVGQRTVTQTVDTQPTLVRPFFNVNTATPAVFIVSEPGLATGSLFTRAAQSLWGAEANYWRNLYYEFPGTSCSVDGMVGVRYLNLNDSVQVGSDSQYAAVKANGILAGNHLTNLDSFSAHNNFYGGQIGTRASLIFDRFIISGQFQLGMGVTNEALNIQGAQIRTLPTGAVIQSPGALLALPSNIGRHSRNEFTMVPEFGATLTIPVNENVAFGVTFTTLYWSRILRAGDQIDTAINVAQIPGFPGAAAAPLASPNHPAAHLNQSDLWLMGAMLTATLRW